MELQSALLAAASLLTEREKIFQIDPKELFMNVLHRTNNVHLLNAAWTGLRNCLNRGDQFLYKYAEQYCIGLAPQSLASTNSELYDQLDDIKDPSWKIQNALCNISSHRVILSERGAELLDEDEERWECIILPNKSLHMAFRSYPERSPCHKETPLTEDNLLKSSEEKEPSADPNNSQKGPVNSSSLEMAIQLLAPIPTRQTRTDTPLTFASEISMNIPTPFKSSSHQFFDFTPPFTGNFQTYDFGPSISIGLQQGQKHRDARLSTVEENSAELEEKEVSGILRGFDYS